MRHFLAAFAAPHNSSASLGRFFSSVSKACLRMRQISAKSKSNLFQPALCANLVYARETASLQLALDGTRSNHGSPSLWVVADQNKDVSLLASPRLE